MYIALDKEGNFISTPKRASLENVNLNYIWKTHYKKIHNEEVVELKKQCLSRNHRISDRFIKNTIIHDCNHNFLDTKNGIALLLDTLTFQNNNDKDKAKKIFLMLKNEKNLLRRLDLANELYKLLTTNEANISIGNSKQNNKIKDHADLNTELIKNKRSFTPASRKIAQCLVQFPNFGLRPPILKIAEFEKRPTFFFLSSILSKGGPNKEEKNIQYENTTPKTHALLQKMITVYHLTPK